MTVVDWILIGALVMFAWAGWRQGFVAGVLSFSGFLIGGVTALMWLPGLVNNFLSDGTFTIIVLAIGVFMSALFGQILLSILGRKLREHITWRPVRLVDNLAGAGLNVLAFALVGWVIASVLVFLPSNDLVRQVTNSQVLQTMDALVPDPARDLFANVSDVVGSTGIPRIVIGLGDSGSAEVDAPESGVSRDVRAVVREFTVKLTGDAPGCNQVVTGSGFYVTDSMLITNAHVVAGVDGLQVRLPGKGRSLPGEVVYFDPEKDIAVVRTDAIDNRPAVFATENAQPGDPAVIAGFPRGGDFTVIPARVRALLLARGENIYGDAGVQREVYSLRANVQSGNSGGPLVDQDARVLGLVFGSSFDSEVGYALVASELTSALDTAKRWKPGDRPADTGSCEIRSQ